ncbi:YlmH family RNA-binding protein [Bacillus benzoevorans]|uniref:RNA-binding protein YlmH n=1 Tax=Bacillus benzoevorans TaxID=1456 RepID=A0A7X0HQ70_9BACI|nr:RNA-binding protein [Bacillus benzoevorans]MBB6443762.1 RNA-binding protein YlmH [Bacillus benzoevorans]
MSIYQHFRPEEKEFIDQVLNWKEYVEQSYSPKLTDFLDPREQQILKMIIGEQGEVLYAFSGGMDFTERNRALIFPDYYQPQADDFHITLFEVEFAKKFLSLTHPQVLGSLMGIGLKRGKFGDIMIVGDRVQFYCAQEVSEYVRLELHSVGKAAVILEEKPLTEGLPPEEVWTEQTVTVSSLRIDAVISAIFQLSRQKSQTLIQSGFVKVNWTVNENPSFECGESDTISVRKYGRAKILSIDGKTKKDKWKITAGRQK